MNFFCVFLFLMMVLWLLSRKNIFVRRSGYFGKWNLLIFEVPILCLCLILRLHFCFENRFLIICFCFIMIVFFCVCRFDL